MCRISYFNVMDMLLFIVDLDGLGDCEPGNLSWVYYSWIRCLGPLVYSSYNNETGQFGEHDEISSRLGHYEKEIGGITWINYDCVWFCHECNTMIIGAARTTTLHSSIKYILPTEIGSPINKYRIWFSRISDNERN